MIEFWLTFNNGAEKLRLPVPPSEYSKVTGINTQTVNINDSGEINQIGKRKLDTLSISSYFPANPNDPIAHYRGYPTPARCLNMISKWRESGRPIRLIISGGTLNINQPMVIESFTVSQKKGPEDVYFDMELKEYRFFNLEVVNEKDNPIGKYVGESRPSERTIPKTYTIVSGDTLYVIAKKFYGDGNKWKELKQRNNIVDERKLKVGQVIKL
ncbi:LysM peptidoglycan-binding domain-containing protein [Paenibacillus spongiae]|uniref:LysM peptidoglycan-binding domain-containing protein n=1 Tax=Paenibacillus spongiae TaxID=2909671 RepID=A0ABY5SDQ1_9BACL|nr:LysM peptidoglycan-binding domain-containing protein [Paenibacillus spongiae]UVI32091.1 LysM peptidoglycan-binding domain-containing protein [Paenibacillus spongiae]